MKELSESEAAKLFTASATELAQWATERTRLDGLEFAVIEMLRQRFEQAERQAKWPTPEWGALSEELRKGNERLTYLERLGRFEDFREKRLLEEKLIPLRERLEALQREQDLRRAIKIGHEIATCVAENGARYRREQLAALISNNRSEVVNALKGGGQK